MLVYATKVKVEAKVWILKRSGFAFPQLKMNLQGLNEMEDRIDEVYYQTIIYRVL